jgi:hypothetical protein
MRYLATASIYASRSTEYTAASKLFSAANNHRWQRSYAATSLKHIAYHHIPQMRRQRPATNITPATSVCALR